jgi:ribosomal peptide maturation radical SAM protein 1
MLGRSQESASLADPFRLAFLHASFRVADEEWQRREGRTPPQERSASLADSGPAADAMRLDVAFRHYVANLSLQQLGRFRSQTASGLLLELDRKLAAPGEPPGERFDPVRVAEWPDRSRSSSRRDTPKVGLLSLPWMSPAMPSIQLATLASALDREGISSDVHELYVDYASRIGLNLYSHLGNLLGYLPEWIFSRHYYGPEQGDDLSAMIEQRPLAEIPWPQYADVILEAIEPVTKEYLDDMLEMVDWAQYDIVGFSLTISQLGASMAFARRIKLRHPEIKIVFGGSQCAGVMGRTILRICPYVDVVVHIEGELVLADLVRRLRNRWTLDGFAGISWRDSHDEIVSGPPGGLHRNMAEYLPLCYDAYFRRITRLDLLGKLKPWLPFEGSRGCWYGQKVQCTFCGLHEIMEFRAWSPDAVLRELERLHARYGIGRFYAMDLILPREYLRSLLPAIAGRDHNWMFFWEIKSNMRREELEVLAAAGVRWVQPGIESLDADLLRLMKKGVSALQNILLLKWCQELGIFCGWNLLTGLPGETSASYERMAAIIPKLYHLKPPSGGGRFQLHRFSPYFDHPEDFGIRWKGAHPMFRYAFPVPQSDLDELVYLHEFEFDGVPVGDSSHIEAAIDGWRRAHHKGASLSLTVHPDGSATIEDTRKADSPPRTFHLRPDEAVLYRLLDRGVKESWVDQMLLQVNPKAFRRLEQTGGAGAAIRQWLSDDLVLDLDGRVVALALYAGRETSHKFEPLGPSASSHLDDALVQINGSRVGEIRYGQES